MPSPAPDPGFPFKVDGNRLIASKELHPDQVREFNASCQSLLEGDQDFIVVDLSDVRFVYSSYVGILSDLATRASERGKRLHLKIGDKIAWIFEMSGLGDKANIEIG